MRVPSSKNVWRPREIGKYLQGVQRLTLFGIHWLVYAIINQKALTIGESRGILCSTSH